MHILTDSKAYRLAQIFDRRAPVFSEVAFLQREIASRMHERLDYMALTPEHILDAGCGPGHDWATLQSRFPTATIVGLDISHRMLSTIGDTQNTNRYSKRPILNLIRTFLNCYNRLSKNKVSTYAVQGNFSALPFPFASFELLWSNLALPWQGPFPERSSHTDQDSIHPLICLFKEWHRVLDENGLLMFSTLGPDSLQELRHAWAQVDAPHSLARVLNFVDMHDLGDMLVHSGFENPVMDSEKLTLTYRNAEALLEDVRRWGAYPLFASSDAAVKRPQGLMGKDAYHALLTALKTQQNSEGTIPLTFEIVYGHAWRPVTTKDSGDDSTKHPLSSDTYAPVQFHPHRSIRSKR